MNINSIQIKNVRGIGDKTIQLNMLPNKPSLLIAPNGSGKSSFAFAFQWLNRLRLKLDPDNAFKGDVNNKPELIVETDEPENNIYVADESHNDVSKRFGIAVINNGLSATTPHVYNGIQTDKARISVPDIVLLDKMPSNIQLNDNFLDIYGFSESPEGLFPVISAFIESNRFMALLDYESLKMTKRPMQSLQKILDRIKAYDGTRNEMQNKIMLEEKENLESFMQIRYAEDAFKKYQSDLSEVKQLLYALRLVTLAYRLSDEFIARIAYSQAWIEEERIKKLFGSLKSTWKELKPHRIGTQVILKLGDVQRISNGERDILILLGHLFEASRKLNKVDNILIIDEVFDYLDDANLIAAQHYINLFIRQLKDEGKNIYPIILSHINPSYYLTFAFRSMKVYYLNSLQYPNASDNMLKLIRKRVELERMNNDDADKISKYMFHYHTDYSEDMTSIIGINDPNWGNIPKFKSYCLNQVEEYISGNRYDALGVCVALREMVEKISYDKLCSDIQKTKFLDDIRGTENKIDYVESLGFVLPDTFSILGLIYNDHLHLNNRNNIDLRQTLYSRLENNTVKGMIGEIKKMYP